jgi:hypothetical protein
MLLVFAVAAYPQTENLGMGAFSNAKGAIKLAVDAALVDANINSPYVMFVLYMAAGKDGVEIVVGREGIVMVYDGQEYKMPSYEELQKNYKGEIHDINFYGHLGKEGIISSWMRLYQFPAEGDFFPPLTLRSPVVADQASIYNNAGFRTKCYFKNPGLKKGDKLVIKVTAKNRPDLSCEVEVVLK